MGLMDWYNGISDKIVGWEMREVAKPIGHSLLDGLTYVGHALTNVMPEIGAGIVIVCGVGMMISGNVPKWLARCAVGLGGVIIWLISA